MEGDPAPGIALPQVSGQWDDADAEALLAAVLTASQSREFRTVRRWSLREGAAKGGPRGVTLECHSGAVLYLRTLPADG